MIKAIIFDLDGTTLNTIEDLTGSVNYALEKTDIPKGQLRIVLDLLEMAYGSCFKELFPRY